MYCWPPILVAFHRHLSICRVLGSTKLGTVLQMQSHKLWITASFKWLTVPSMLFTFYTTNAHTDPQGPLCSFLYSCFSPVSTTSMLLHGVILPQKDLAVAFVEFHEVSASYFSSAQMSHSISPSLQHINCSSQSGSIHKLAGSALLTWKRGWNADKLPRDDP